MYTICYVDLWQYKHNRYSRRKSLSLGLKKIKSHFGQILHLAISNWTKVNQ